MKRALAVVAAATAGAAGLFGLWLALPLPATLLAPPARAGVTLVDRHGQPMRHAWAADDADRRWVRLADLDPDVVRAFIALEDNRFYAHHGVDLRAALRAARDNARAHGVVSGASTITMQLARLLVPLPRTWSGKLRQAAWAWRLEAHLGKQEILEQYLNRLPLGQGNVGVGAAVSRYFDAAPGRLSLGEAALLAWLARAPSHANPLADPVRARRGRAAALGVLRARGMVSPSDSARATEEPLLTPRRGTFEAAHFTAFVLSTAAASPPSATVRTTLDLALQTELESEVRHTVVALHDRGVRQAALVVLDNATGGVLAWVGSPDFFAPDDGQVDMVVSPRQPGSALKPFLYGLAFDHGFTPASILPDVARTYATSTGTYAPHNYDRRFHGPVSAREALASSHNVPAVELVNRLDAGALLSTLHRAGFSSLDRSAAYYGLGLALGNGDVTLIELANGYRSLADGGVWRAWTWRDDGGTAGRLDDSRRVMSPVAAALVLDILSDPVARIPGFGTETPFDFPFPAAVKTGTSRNYTDNWAIAVTGRFTVAVWAGDFSGRPMEQVSGVSGAGPLLQRAVLRVARRYPPGVLARPVEVGARRVTVCRVSGSLPGPDCPTVGEWVPGDADIERCTWHQAGRLVLPAEYAEWAKMDAGPTMRARNVAVPAAAVGSPVFRIVAPQDGDRYSVPPGTDPRFATLALRAVAPPETGPVRWFVDGKPLAGTRWRLEPGPHTLRAVTSRASDEVHVVVD